MKEKGSCLVKILYMERLIQDGTSLVKYKDQRDETEYTVKVANLKSFFQKLHRISTWTPYLKYLILLNM